MCVGGSSPKPLRAPAIRRGGCGGGRRFRRAGLAAQRAAPLKGGLARVREGIDPGPYGYIIEASHLIDFDPPHKLFFLRVLFG